METCPHVVPTLHDFISSEEQSHTEFEQHEGEFWVLLLVRIL